MAQTLHFGRAAEQLSITQPVLSDQIQRLEQLLGVQLLHRTKRVVQLTEPGRIFLTAAIQVLGHARGAIATVQRAAQGLVGQLSIGYTGPALYTVLPEIVRTFRDRYPDVAQEVTPQPTMIGLVAAGLGIALVSSSMQTISRPGVVYRELQEATPVLRLAIAWNDEGRSFVLQNFLQVVNTPLFGVKRHFDY